MIPFRQVYLYRSTELLSYLSELQKYALSCVLYTKHMLAGEGAHSVGSWTRAELKWLSASAKPRISRNIPGTNS
jgi:hypothetical protein